MHAYGDDFRRVTARPYLGFIGKRFARVYPVHLFALLALVLVESPARRYFARHLSGRKPLPPHHPTISSP